MMNYSDMVKNLCIENCWFTEGSAAAFQKLMYACDDIRYDLSDIACMIWVNSNAGIEDIMAELEEAESELLEDF